MKLCAPKSLSRLLALSLAIVITVGTAKPPIVAYAAAPDKEISIDFAETTGPMQIKTGFQLTPNEDITDGRILPLNSSMIRGDLDIQNIMIGNGATNNDIFNADALPAQFSRMDRIQEGLTRMNGLGIDYYPVMGYFASWVSKEGWPCGGLKDRAS
ncbi:MAG: hypothetical protein RR502_07865, partial [Oscillospiraceae bacterium]